MSWTAPHEILYDTANFGRDRTALTSGNEEKLQDFFSMEERRNAKITYRWTPSLELWYYIHKVVLLEKPNQTSATSCPSQPANCIKCSPRSRKPHRKPQIRPKPHNNVPRCGFNCDTDGTIVKGSFATRLMKAIVRRINSCSATGLTVQSEAFDSWCFRLSGLQHCTTIEYRLPRLPWTISHHTLNTLVILDHLFSAHFPAPQEKIFQYYSRSNQTFIVFSGCSTCRRTV